MFISSSLSEVVEGSKEEKGWGRIQKKFPLPLSPWFDNRDIAGESQLGKAEFHESCGNAYDITCGFESRPAHFISALWDSSYLSLISYLFCLLKDRVCATSDLRAPRTIEIQASLLTLKREILCARIIFNVPFGEYGVDARHKLPTNLLLINSS